MSSEPTPSESGPQPDGEKGGAPETSPSTFEFLAGHESPAPVQFQNEEQQPRGEFEFSNFSAKAYAKRQTDWERNRQLFSLSGFLKALFAGAVATGACVSIYHLVFEGGLLREVPYRLGLALAGSLAGGFAAFAYVIFWPLIKPVVNPLLGKGFENVDFDQVGQGYAPLVAFWGGIVCGLAGAFLGAMAPDFTLERKLASVPAEQRTAFEALGGKDHRLFFDDHGRIVTLQFINSTLRVERARRIAELADLERLDVADSFISLAAFSTLRVLPLRTLNIRTSHVDPAEVNGPSRLATTPEEALERKGAQREAIAQMFRDIGQIKTLRKLQVRMVGISDAALDGLAGLAELEDLSLVCETESSLATLQGATISIPADELSGPAVGRLANLKKLKKLSLSGYAVEVEGLEALKTALPDLQIDFK